jgi:DNA-binding transcriptional LysR family regulator
VRVASKHRGYRGCDDNKLDALRHGEGAPRLRDFNLGAIGYCPRALVRRPPSIERDMIAVRVTDELPLAVAGSPAYFAQRGKPKSPKDLVAHDCIRTRFASGTYLPWRFRVKRRDLEVHVEGRLVVNSASLARRVAVEGLALVQTPLLFIASDLNEGMQRQFRLAAILAIPASAHSSS